jgi:hypothetical protein
MDAERFEGGSMPDASYCHQGWSAAQLAAARSVLARFSASLPLVPGLDAARDADVARLVSLLLLGR